MNQTSPIEIARQYDARIAENVLTRRRMSGLSQEKVGDALGITFQQVQKYERGANRISAGKLRQLAELYDCTINDLYGIGEDIDAPTDDTFQRRDTCAMARAFNNLDGKPAVKQHLLSLAQAVGRT